MNKVVVAGVLCVLVGSVTWSGVVIELEQTEGGSAGDGAMETIYAQDTMLRMEPAAAKGADSMTVIFRDDTLYLVDDDKKRAQTIDKKDMQEVSAKMGDAMKKMEAELAKLPPEQRAMMEKMMKDRMPQGMSPGGQDSPPRRIEVGGTEQVGGYSCTVHTQYAGDDKVWEVCAAAGGLPGDASEAMEAFQAMSRFAADLRESFQQGPTAFMVNVDTPYHAMDEVDGFPVRVRTFDDGRMISEQTLKSITNQDLDKALFTVPKGYKVKSVTDEMKGMR